MTDQTDKTAKPPRRAFRLTLKIEADDRIELANALYQFGSQLEADQISTGVWGGPSSGGIYELSIDPDMTHDRYFEGVRQYLESLKADPTR